MHVKQFSHYNKAPARVSQLARPLGLYARVLKRVAATNVARRVTTGTALMQLSGPRQWFAHYLYCMLIRRTRRVKLARAL